MPADEATEAERHADNQRRLADVEETVARIVERLDRVGIDVHTMKGNLAANTGFSREALAGIEVIRGLIAQLDIPALKDMGETMAAMRGGVKVLGWLERPAKWLATMAAAAAAIYGLWKLK